MLELVDDDIQWLVVPTGDVISGKTGLAELAANHLKEGRIDRVQEDFDMDTVKRLTRSAATAGQQQP